MRPGRFVALALVLGAPAVAAASDAPHNLSAPTASIACSDCHSMHKALGAVGLLTQPGNYNNCYSCHNGTMTDFGGDWATDQAVPGVGGQSHRWDAMSTNLGATPPDPSSVSTDIRTMAANLDQGKLECSTCHDQHTGASRNMGASPQHTSVAIVPPAQTCTTTCILRSAGTGTGTLQLSSVATNAPPKGYLIKISTGSPSPQFIVSFDNGNTWSTPVSFTPGTAINAVAGDSSVMVKFNTGTFNVGDTFKNFYVSYPFLRAGNTDSAMCKVCHKDRVMKYQDVEGGVANGFVGDLTTVTLGQTVFHHPTSQTLNANGDGYDRAATNILDADGSLQFSGTTDSNKTNDLVFGTGNTVQCMTCHQPHVADSNSLTVDPRTPTPP